MLALMAAACDLEPGRVERIVEATDAVPRRVPTASGPVVGRASPAGQAFLGIPYAAPPVGALRWRAPQPVAPWAEPREAVRLGETCLQNLSLDAQTGGQGSGPVPGAEDCLTLNVYAPADAAPADRRPVMVWIHGGAWILGSGGQYDPSLLARNTGALVVTFNYRLGVLGFLAHPGLRGAPGEGAFALLDQQAALRWVRANIAGFGGDPHAVTLFGQSAGAWSVCSQMAAPGAAGLFGRAILESGACITPQTSLPAAAAEQGGVRMAQDLGCGTDPAAALDCLRRMPARELVLALPQRAGATGPNAWAPATGLDVLPLSPRAAFESGRYARVPVIDGTNRDEGRLFAYLRGYKGDLWTEGSFEEAIEALFGPASGAVLAEYPAAALGSPGRAYAAILTDALFACPARSLDRLLARRTPVYAYEFDDPEAPFRLPGMPWSHDLRSYHTAEIAYVFDRPWVLADPAGFDPAQAALSARIQAHWGAFAAAGTPSAPGQPPWPAFSAQDGAVARLGPGATGQVGDFAERHRCDFWGRLGY